MNKVKQILLSIVSAPFMLLAWLIWRGWNKPEGEAGFVQVDTLLVVTLWMWLVAAGLAFTALGVQIGCSNILGALGYDPLAWCLVALILAACLCAALGALFWLDWYCGPTPRKWGCRYP